MTRPKEYIIYCDESVTKEAHFSNFYGGAILRSDHIDFVRESIAVKKAALNLHGEVKWSKISANYKDKYIALVEHTFDLVDAGYIKFRIMFTQNMFAARGLTAEQRDQSYFLLYYQFIKHAFGLAYLPQNGTDCLPVSLRVYLDLIPDTDEKKAIFKSHLCALQDTIAFRSAKIVISEENVTDVVSHDHDILQCLDVILGSMQFRLNDKHLVLAVGKKRRGNRTVAKEQVYKAINARIRSIRPNFNIGISTGTDGDISNRWHHAYSHWRFMPTDFEIVGGSKR